MSQKLETWGESSPRAVRLRHRLEVPPQVGLQFPEQFDGCCLDHADVLARDEEHHVGSGVGWADPDVVEFAVVADSGLARFGLQIPAHSTATSRAA
jgi:hypothetical protein